MAISVVWLSALLKRGIKPRTIMKCTWHQTFKGLFQELDKVEETVEKVEISRNESFTDPAHIVPLEASVMLCKLFFQLFIPFVLFA